MFGKSSFAAVTALLAVGQVSAGPIDRPWSSGVVDGMIVPRVDAGPSCNRTMPALKGDGGFFARDNSLMGRAPGCIPKVWFDCTNYPNACEGMCFNYYCRSSNRVGVYPDSLHRGSKGSSSDRRKTGGWRVPSNTASPCRNDKKYKDGKGYNFQTDWTSMDEFPMAIFLEGGGHGSSGPGFRCIKLGENSGAGSKMKALLNSAGVSDKYDTYRSENEFDLGFTVGQYMVNRNNRGSMIEDWCDVNSRGKPITKCKNDYNFESYLDSRGSWAYTRIPSGKQDYSANRAIP